MKIRISSIVHLILGVILVVSIASLSTSAVDYDPLLDVTGDGYGGIDDIVMVAEHFGASGAPINWTQVLENIAALEDRVTILEDQLSTVDIVHADLINTVTNPSGNVDVHYPVGKFSTTPSLAVTAQFNSGGSAYMGHVTISSHTSTGFTLNVKDGFGTNWSGNVQICYTAVQ
jgi:hypothetical protein